MPFRRALLRALLAAAPACVVVAAPTLIACGSKPRPVKKPVVRAAPRPSGAQALGEARAAAKAGDTTTAHARYKEAEKLDLNAAVVDEHVKFLLAHRLPDPAVEVAKAYYE